MKSRVRMIGRSHLLVTLMLLTGMLLAACGSTPAANTPAPTEVPAAAPTEVPAVAPTEAPAVEPTTAPAATEVPVTEATEAPAAATEVPVTEATEAPAAAATTAAELPAAEGTFTYWGGLIFSETANNLVVERVQQWGKERGVPVDVVMINQNETVQRVSAAVEAGTMPDALDMGRDLMLLLSQSQTLEPVDALYDQIGTAHGGWMESASSANDPKDFGGQIYGIPYGTSGNLINRRVDLLEPAGYTAAPTTWQELGEMAVKVNNPPEAYGMGFALSNVGDGNLMSSVLQSWGGRIADDAGKQCTLDSPETREFLTWVTGLYDQGVFPPGATTWDGAGDNTAYQSGQAVFIANPGSVYLNLRENDPELADVTQFSALPAGPKMRVAPQGPTFRVISASSRNKELAKDLLAYMADDAFMEEYYNSAIFGPVLSSQQSFATFANDPVHKGLLDLALNGTAPAFPDTNNAAFAEFQTNFPIPKMIQRIVVDKVSIDAAVAETQASCQAIYDKYQ